MVVASNLTLHDSTDRPAADAIMTTEYRVVAVRTADCLPILLATSDGQWVAAVHAGWRGFSRGILSKTLELATQLHPKKTLLAMVGPSISRERFEVGPEVLDALRSADTRLSDAAFNLSVAKGLGDRWHVDLSLAAACQLLEYDIDPNSIEVMQSCTYQDTQGHHHRWHSYRRDGRNCGSNWTWIQGPQA
jgi:YfiH family protein